MTPAAVAQQLAKAKGLVATAKRIVVLTGAGVSAESGIPTFRGEGGLWRKYDATMLATPQAFVRDPSLVWEFYHYRREVVSRCRPNPAHTALAAFEEQAALRGVDVKVITQNIDRLHQAAGSKNVIELHGSLWDVCVATPAGFKDQSRRPWEDRTQPLVPALASTGSPDSGPADVPIEDLPHDEQGQLLRPGVVWFNEGLDDDVIDKVEDLLDATDLLLVVGTSSVVFPAAGYAPRVRQRGVPVVEINLEATGSSSICSLSIQGKAGQLLPELLGVAEDPRVAAAVAAQQQQQQQPDTQQTQTKQQNRRYK